MWLHTSIHPFVHTYTNIHTHTYIHTYIHTYACTQTYIHTYIHTLMYTYILSYTYIYVHNNPFPVASWSLVVCIMSTCFDIIHTSIGAIGSSPRNGLKANLWGQKGFNPLRQCVYVYVKPDIQTIHRCSYTYIQIYIHTYMDVSVIASESVP